MRSLADLIDSFVDATKEDKLKWSHGGVDTYTTSLPSTYTVKTWHWTDPDSGDGGVTVQLLKNGQIIDVVQADEYSQSYAGLYSLFTVARRSAHDVDSIIDDIEGILSSLTPKK